MATVKIIVEHSQEALEESINKFLRQEKVRVLEKAIIEKDILGIRVNSLVDIKLATSWETWHDPEDNRDISRPVFNALIIYKKLK